MASGLNCETGPGPSISLSDCMCPVCLSIIIEPVTMPCGHELCMPCFKLNVQETSLTCPMCRKRISTWARQAARNNTLVNQRRWREIQLAFPEKVKHRLEGDEEDDSMEEALLLPSQPHLCEPGEIRKEYEAELKKLQAEMERRRQAEAEASELLIMQLQLEEEEKRREAELQRLNDEAVARELEQTLLDKKDPDDGPPVEDNLRCLTRSSSATSTNTSSGRGSTLLEKYLTRSTKPDTNNSDAYPFRCFTPAADGKKEMKDSTGKQDQFPFPCLTPTDTGKETKKSSTATATSTETSATAQRPASNGSNSSTVSYVYVDSEPNTPAPDRSASVVIISGPDRQPSSTDRTHQQNDNKKTWTTVPGKTHTSTAAETVTMETSELIEEMGKPESTKNGEDRRSASVASDDSITQELVHFKPIHTCPRTPPRRLPGGKVVEPPLIRSTPQKLGFGSPTSDVCFSPEAVGGSPVMQRRLVMLAAERQAQVKAMSKATSTENSNLAVLRDHSYFSPKKSARLEEAPGAAEGAVVKEHTTKRLRFNTDVRDSMGEGDADSIAPKPIFPLEPNLHEVDENIVPNIIRAKIAKLQENSEKAVDLMDVCVPQPVVSKAPCKSKHSSIEDTNLEPKSSISPEAKNVCGPKSPGKVYLMKKAVKKPALSSKGKGKKSSNQGLPGQDGFSPQRSIMDWLHKQKTSPGGRHSADNVKLCGISDFKCEMLKGDGALAKEVGNDRTECRSVSAPLVLATNLTLGELSRRQKLLAMGEEIKPTPSRVLLVSKLKQVETCGDTLEEKKLMLNMNKHTPSKTHKAAEMSESEDEEIVVDDLPEEKEMPKKEQMPKTSTPRTKKIQKKNNADRASEESNDSEFSNPRTAKNVYKKREKKCWLDPTQDTHSEVKDMSNEDHRAIKGVARRKTKRKRLDSCSSVIDSDVTDVFDTPEKGTPSEAKRKVKRVKQSYECKNVEKTMREEISEANNTPIKTTKRTQQNQLNRHISANTTDSHGEAEVKTTEKMTPSKGKRKAKVKKQKHLPEQEGDAVKQKQPQSSASPEKLLSESETGTPQKVQPLKGKQNSKRAKTKKETETVGSQSVEETESLKKGISRPVRKRERGTRPNYAESTDRASESGNQEDFNTPVKRTPRAARRRVRGKVQSSSESSDDETDCGKRDNLVVKRTGRKTRGKLQNYTEDLDDDLDPEELNIDEGIFKRLRNVGSQGARTGRKHNKQNLKCNDEHQNDEDCDAESESSPVKVLRRKTFICTRTQMETKDDNNNEGMKFRSGNCKKTKKDSSCGEESSGAGEEGHTFHPSKLKRKPIKGGKGGVKPRLCGADTTESNKKEFKKGKERKDCERSTPRKGEVSNLKGPEVSPKRKTRSSKNDEDDLCIVNSPAKPKEILDSQKWTPNRRKRNVGQLPNHMENDNDKSLNPSNSEQSEGNVCSLHAKRKLVLVTDQVDSKTRVQKSCGKISESGTVVGKKVSRQMKLSWVVAKESESKTAENSPKPSTSRGRGRHESRVTESDTRVNSGTSKTSTKSKTKGENFRSNKSKWNVTPEDMKDEDSDMPEFDTAEERKAWLEHRDMQLALKLQADFDAEAKLHLTAIRRKGSEGEYELRGKVMDFSAYFQNF